ncbi:MAG TPA: type II CAAX endopeptidase family protein [Kofleriaceae bacterium]
MGLTAAAIATIYGVQLVLHGLGVPDLIGSVTSDAIVIGGVVIVARRRGLQLADVGLRRTPARFLVAALLIGLAAWYLTAWLVQLLHPPGDTSKLEQFIAQTPLAITLVALTVFPAIAEELVFRGVLARSLAPRFGSAGAIVISAAGFGLYHLFPPQIVSTFALGLALAFLTLRARSIVPAMIVHVLNNTIAIVLPRDEIPAAGAFITAYPVPMFVGAIVLVGCGLGLAAKGVT